MDEKRNEFQKKALSLQKLGQAITFQSELMLQHRGAFTCQETVEKADRATEKARVLVRELILESGHARAIEITEEILAETVPVSMGFTVEGWFWLHIPLLPPKKTAGSAKYVRSYLYPAMQKYFANLSKRRIFSQCVVIFLHRYDVKLFSQNYHRIHFIPMTEEGIKMLQILVVPNWQHRILHMLFEEEQIMLNTGSFQFDALVDDTRVLCFMDCDILKLISFYKAARESDFSWSVVCFDSQVDFLRSYLGDTADLRSFDLNDFHKEMEANRKALL